MAKLTFFNVAICLVVACGGFAYGFGFAVFVTSIGQPGFYLYFNLDPKSAYTANILGAVNALFSFGLAAGSIIQGWTSDWLGRKKALFVAGIFSLIGAGLVAGSVTISMLIVTRLLQGFGLGMLICLIPLYTTEVAPPHRRGLLSGMTTMSFATGYFTNSWISFGTAYATNLTLAWRLPLALACVGPLLLLTGLPFIPETPRYLSWLGKDDEAWGVLRDIHHDPQDSTDAAARAEFIQITRQVAHDKQMKSGYLQMFTQPSLRRRSLLVMFLLQVCPFSRVIRGTLLTMSTRFASQSTGILGIANFIILIFDSLGLSLRQSLLMYAVFNIVGTGSAYIACFNVDRFGRRRLFLIGFPLLACCLLAEAILQWKYLGTLNKPGNAACVLFIFIYIICFQCIDGPSFIWAAEIFPTTVRAKGIGLTFFAYFVGAITYTTPAALAFRNIQWRMYLIYMTLCIIAWPIVYVYIPETTKIPVEELGAMFGDEVVVHMTTDGYGLVEESLVSETGSPNEEKAQHGLRSGHDKPDGVDVLHCETQSDNEKTIFHHPTRNVV